MSVRYPLKLPASLPGCAYVLSLALTACAAAPVSRAPIPEAALADCTDLASQASTAGNTALRTATSAAKGAAIDAAIKSAVVTSSSQFLRLPISTVTTLSATSLLPLFAAIGVIEGLADAAAERARITRECLRDRGHKVY